MKANYDIQFDSTLDANEYDMNVFLIEVEQFNE